MLAVGSDVEDIDRAGEQRVKRLPAEEVAPAIAHIIEQFKRRMFKPEPIREPFVRYVNGDSITHSARAIGDNNPLWIDEEYGKKTRYGKNIAPPSLYSHSRGIVLDSHLWFGLNEAALVSYSRITRTR